MMMKLTKEMLGEALDYMSDAPWNKEDYMALGTAAKHSIHLFEAARRLYVNWDALEALHEAGEKATKVNIDTDQGGEVTAADGTTLLAAPEYNPAPNFINDAEFCAISFTTRPAIRNLIGGNDE
jgi:hypothetical protein